MVIQHEAREEIALLYQVSKDVNQAASMDEVLVATKALFPDPILVSIFAWEHYDFSQAKYLLSICSTDPKLPPGTRLPRMILSGASKLVGPEILTANNVFGPEWVNRSEVDFARFFNLYSIAYTNLFQGNRIQGLFSIASYEPYHFNAQEMRLMAAAAGLTAAALERFRSQQAAVEAREEREQLYEASRAINAASTFQEILRAVEHIAFDNGVYYLYIFENFNYSTANYIETVATGENRFMREGTRIPLSELPFLKKNPRPGLWAYEDVANHPELDAVTKATMLEQGVRSNLRFGLFWDKRQLGAFGVDHDWAKVYTEREIRMMTAMGELVSAGMERIRLQRETQSAREKAERLAAQAQQLAALEERTRLARELHDSVSQALYGIGLGAQTAKLFLDKDPRRVRESVEYVLSLAEAGLAEMRALIFELRPESLENEGLVVALVKQSASLQARHHIKVRLDLCNEPALVLSDKESLYRVAREALHNVVKHANATKIDLRLICKDGQLHLHVIDDGVGFETQRDFPGHLGLQSMHERVAQLGGMLSIISTINEGTHLSVCLPL